MLAIKTPIGDLDKRLIILTPTISRPNTNEDQVTGWTELAEVWGKVTPFSGNEAMIAEKLTETHGITVEINHRTDVTSLMRLVLYQKVYKIDSIPPSDDRNRRLKILASLIENELWT